MQAVVNEMWRAIKEITQSDKPQNIGDLYALVSGLNEIWKCHHSWFVPSTEVSRDEQENVENNKAARA